MSKTDNNRPDELPNVIYLFGQEAMKELTLGELAEDQFEDWDLGQKTTKNIGVSPKSMLVNENHFPDQSVVILQQQMENLKQRLDRIRFYLSDMDDLIPKK